MKNTLLVATMLAVAGLTGCIERTQKVTLNPDGSGKMDFDLLVVANPPMPFDMKQQPAVPPAEQLKKAVETMIGGSEGIEAWKNVAFELAKDGRFHVSGTCYFKDFNHRAFHLGSTTLKSGENWGANPDGGMQLTLAMKPGDAPKMPDESLPKTDAELEAKLAESRQQWQMMKPMMSSMLGTMKEDSTYLLPGKITDTGAFLPVPGGVRIGIDGSKLIAAMDQVIADDALMRDALKTGNSPLVNGPQDERMGKILFGRPGKPIAKVSGELKPQFDYNAEVAAAKAGLPDMVKKLGITPQAATKPASPME